ncbi:MAG: A/G-specific adenine glycosylase [Acidobacteriota bacterium]|nr:MAG: A/G-specific adenine glycosylase [Acidobacteriota bacterium]
MIDSVPESALPAAAPALRQRLLAWYERERRDLPWRRRSDAYAIWVSEIMLQQTTVQTVVPYWRRFLELFPNVRSLANADLDAVLGAWSGLGYSRRARMLHAAAKRIVNERGGRLPQTLEGWRALPGVGSYTAAAIGSIALGLPSPAIDGNVQRVLTRLTKTGGDPRRTAVARRLESLARSLIDEDRPGEFNQALMELGAMVCLPRRPSCPSCPWGTSCAARRDGVVEDYPQLAPARPAVTVVRGAVRLFNGRGRVLLTRVAPGEPNQGLLELPGTVLYHGRSDHPAHAPRRWCPELALQLRDRLASEKRLFVEIGSLLRRVRHGITHHRITVYLTQAEAVARVPSGKAWCWVDPRRLSGLPLTGVTRRLLESG